MSSGRQKTTPSEVMRRLSEAEVKRLMLARYKRRNTLVGLGLLAGVLGVYAYSMLAVRQENLDLDELIDPNKDISNNPGLNKK